MKNHSAIVLGAGSAGLIAALTLKARVPGLQVSIIRSPEIGTIQVGEGTTPTFPIHLFENLGISHRRFYSMAEPTWKLGARFLWGPRDYFDYPFSTILDAHWSNLKRPNGYYCDDDFHTCGYVPAFMEADKVFPRDPRTGLPAFQKWFAFHIENRKLISCLEAECAERGIAMTDGTFVRAERGEQGIAAIHLEDGRRMSADLFVDASGFRSELLGRVLEEPFVSYGDTLFCDRAVVGGWDRGDGPIPPYTTVETMEAGWAWQIEHEHVVNRGYVFSSRHISDDAAHEEFRRKNPKTPEQCRLVKFKSGRYRRLWVDNVVAIGNAGGFVEPLEATALMIACLECQYLTASLAHFGLGSVTPGVRDVFNGKMSRLWDDTRDFLAIHYKFNTRVETPFWKQCQEETSLGDLEEMVEFYRENGPSGFCRYFLKDENNPWGVDGYLVMLVGNRVPYAARRQASAEELANWAQHKARFRQLAEQALDTRQVLAAIRHPGWRWNQEIEAVRAAAATRPAGPILTATSGFGTPGGAPPSISFVR